VAAAHRDMKADGLRSTLPLGNLANFRSQRPVERGPIAHLLGFGLFQLFKGRTQPGERA